MDRLEFNIGLVAQVEMREVGMRAFKSRSAGVEGCGYSLTTRIDVLLNELSSLRVAEEGSVKDGSEGIVYGFGVWLPPR